MNHFPNSDTCSSIKRWQFKYKIMLKSNEKDEKEATHRLLDGGNLHVPEEIEQLFYEKYASDIFMNRVNYILETKTPIYRLLMDLDIYESREISYDELREWIFAIQDVVNDMYPQLSSYERRCVICTTDPSPNALKNGKVFVKQGLGHLIWPDIKINNQKGLIFRKACLQKMESKFGPRHADNIWGDVIDDTLYKANGLRMIGSSKLSHCKYCKKRRGEYDHSCDVCFGTGKFCEGRVYKIKEIIDGDKNILKDKMEYFSSNLVDMIKEVSIRTKDQFCTPQSLPKWFDSFHYEYDKDAQQNVRKTKERFYIHDQGYLTAEDLEGAKEHNIEEKYRVGQDTKIFKTIKKMINKTMPQIYKNVDIIDIHFCNAGSNDYYLVRVNSSFCMNVARYHNSNTIYFVVTEYGICQKCFCRCKTLEGRKYNVYCSEFRSALRNISPSIKKILFSITSNRRKILPPKQANRKKLEEYIRRKKIEIQIRQDFIDGKLDYEDRFNSKRQGMDTSAVFL